MTRGWKGTRGAACPGCDHGAVIRGLKIHN
nr:MAG TPA: hypothetical protein [Inoviridae sp.]